MTTIDQLQKLDALIVQHTQPPVTSVLRNQLSLTIEQCEAYQAASDKQDQTLAAQLETIERLMKENLELNAKIKSTNRDAWDELRKKSEDYNAMIRSKQLKEL